ncbi:hypothetical protein [Limimaricola litoreus]|uniref:hypothetical protein n=1 Tax=Limimaricola litoreus TaxID=2955316 RepID=UPI003F811C7C
MKHGGRPPQNYLKPWRKRQRREVLDASLHFIKRKNPFHQHPSTYYFDHMRAKAIRSRVGADIFSSYLKIAIVRDPFDYALSRYRFTLKQNKIDPLSMTFGRFLTDMPERLVENRRITEIDGVSVIDHMIRFEDFENGIRQLSEKLCLGGELLNTFRKVNAKKSGRNPKEDLNLYKITPEAILLIEILCKKDIEDFGYTAPTWTP